MKCIVTAGPTYEELDKVRRLTNFSTGALGSCLADHLIERGHEVDLLLGHYSVRRPKLARPIAFTTTADLRAQLEKLASPEIGAVFHAAAVSDFGFGKIWRRLESGELQEIRAAKIPTRGQPVMVELKPTGKIIRHLRQWFPSAWIVGWKYEMDGHRDSVIELARRQIQENKTDACVANGWAYGEGFGLVTSGADCRHVPDQASLCRELEEGLRR